MAWHKANESSNAAGAYPRSTGVGPIGAVQLTMKTPDPKLFISGRQFAAWIGLTPKAAVLPSRNFQTSSAAAGRPPDVAAARGHAPIYLRDFQSIDNAR